MRFRKIHTFPEKQSVYHYIRSTREKDTHTHTYTHFLRVVKPDFHWDLGEGRIEEGHEMFGDTGTGSRSHLFDDLLGVLVEELIHSLADDVVAVQLVGDTETSTSQTEIDEEPSDLHVANAVALLFDTLDSGDCCYVA